MDKRQSNNNRNKRINTSFSEDCDNDHSEEFLNNFDEMIEQQLAKNHKSKCKLDTP